MIHNANLQFSYVTDRMLRLGEFDASRYKVLILPLSFAIGRNEANVIREFVRKGGTIIADVRPGMYDGHCKPLEKGILDDVFGIERDEKYDAIGIDRMNVNGEINGQKLTMSWGNWHGKEIYPEMKIDPTVKLTTGKELGRAFHVHFVWDLNTPVCVVNEYGKGRAILLNFAIYDAPVEELIKGLLASVGIKPQIILTRLDGTPVKGVELTRWQNGDYELMALFGTYDGVIKVQLPQNKNIYDLKAHQSLGDVKEFSTHVRPNRAKFFALLPKDSPKPKLTLKRNTLPRGSVANMTLEIPNAEGKHAIRIRVVSPAGFPVSWFNKNVLLGSEKKDIELPFAYNDLAGIWKISAIDLFTNEAVTSNLTLK
jgi:beta-galactosidase